MDTREHLSGECAADQKFAWLSDFIKTLESLEFIYEKKER